MDVNLFQTIAELIIKSRGEYEDAYQQADRKPGSWRQSQKVLWGEWGFSQEESDRVNQGQPRHGQAGGRKWKVEDGKDSWRKRFIEGSSYLSFISVIKFVYSKYSRNKF